MRQIFLYFLSLCCFAVPSFAARVNGLVVGLANKGDSKSDGIVRTVANSLQRFGLDLQGAQLKSDNVAAVMVTADIPAYARAGTRIDVTVASIADAKTISGGILLQTPLLGADETVYAVAQGAIAVGGFLGGEGGVGGATIQKNHPTVGIISGGALVEREIPATFVRDNNVELIEVEPDVPARIVINERTGTIIATSNVRISTVAVSHGSLTISIVKNPVISQPNPFTQRALGAAATDPAANITALNGAGTVVANTTKLDIKEQAGKFGVVEDSPTIQQVASALNALGMSTRDMMAIFQTMKRAGALQAELILN